MCLEKKSLSRFPQAPTAKPNPRLVAGAQSGLSAARRPLSQAIEAGAGPVADAVPTLVQAPMASTASVQPEPPKFDLKFEAPPRTQTVHVQGNGFTSEESRLIHDALRLAQMRWFDGEGSILGKSDKLEVTIRPGASEQQRWAVMAVPIFDMNAPGAVEICLHFMAESFNMAHVLDFQYQIAINMEVERLEFLMQIPIAHLNAAQVGEVIRTFTEAMMESLTQELSALMETMKAAESQ